MGRGSRATRTRTPTPYPTVGQLAHSRRRCCAWGKQGGVFSWNGIGGIFGAGGALGPSDTRAEVPLHARQVDPPNPSPP